MFENSDSTNYKRVAHHSSSQQPMVPKENGNGHDGDIELQPADSGKEEGFDIGMQVQESAWKEPPEDLSVSIGCRAYLAASWRAVLLGSKLNVLMLLTPLAFLSHSFRWGDGLTFMFALLAIAPFAERLGYVTEQMAMYTNETLGGLLNASFGNATEMIVSIFALIKGKPGGSANPEVYRRLVQVSLLGSILSNLLLVLGSALFVGGRKHQTQTFTKIGATTSMGLLVLSTTTYCLPVILLATDEIEHEAWAMLPLSRFISVLLLGVYMVFLYFQLVTHRELYEEGDGADDVDDDDEDEAILGFYGSILWLGILTVFISFLSEYMVDAIEGTVRKWGISELFIGAIIIPIVGNAAEHASAVIFAYRNKMDITLGVAVGSAVQIAVSALPLCVIIGWIIGCPLDISLSVFEASSLVFSVILVGVTLQDGSSHWMHGIVLIVAYVTIAAGFWFHKSSL